MNAPTRPELDEVRQLVLSRSRELGITLADLSRAVGRNMSYVHQFIHRGSPAILPEDARGLLAAALQLPEASLKRRAPGRSDVPTLDAAAIDNKRSKIDLLAGRDVRTVTIPVYEEEIDERKVREWVAAPDLLNAGKIFAVWIRYDRGQARAGDLVFFQATQPPRIGDTVAVLSGTKIVDIGNLHAIDDKSAVVQHKAGAKLQNFPIPSHRLLRAMLIVCK